ncbi:MAG: FtsQ-type POTRA domain-containing protein [Oscillospiraceae bacterium]|nr:FtsQ-type POTRA domain-containing protein [Oscillospiraceae bacterium]
MAETNPQRTPRRRRKRKSALFTPLAFVLICAALIFGMSVFFRVTTIVVTGAVNYEEAEIIGASGIEPGDNLIFIDRSGAASRIRSKLPYIESVAVRRVLPNTVNIEILESRALAYLAVDGELWAIDRSCKALAKTTSAQVEGLIHVTGIEATKPSVGEIISGKDAENSKLEYLAVILREVAARGMESEISSMDLTNLANPTFDYESRFLVRLGKNEDVGYKLDRMLSVVEQLGESDVGTLDLSIDDRVHFSQG